MSTTTWLLLLVACCFLTWAATWAATKWRDQVRFEDAGEAEMAEAMAVPDVLAVIKATFAAYDQEVDDRVLCVRCPAPADTLTADGVPVCSTCKPIETRGGAA